MLGGSVDEGPLGGELARLEALADPTRRRLYAYVSGRSEAVGRDEAAEQLGLPRHAVKFHLDRLVERGLLVTEYRRLSGRTGPGAGRTAKLYRTAPGEVSVTLPPRRYALVADILAEAVERAVEGEPLPRAVQTAAQAAGARLAESSGVDHVVDALAGLGYEPRASTSRVELANCPYQAVAGRHTSVICGMNLAFVEGLLPALGPPGAKGRLDPEAGRCCVVVDLPPSAP
ncbi:MAG: helix-turn-helix transcriptional regulator [Kineosporiaceae bacterium]